MIKAAFREPKQQNVVVVFLTPYRGGMYKHIPD